MATSNLDVTFEQVLKRVLNMEEREVTNNVAIEGFKMENAAIKKDLQRMEQQEEKAEAENSRLRGEMVTLSDRMKNLEAENERLKEAVKTVSGTTKDVDRLMTKVAILEGHVIPQLKNKSMKAKNETKSLKGEVNGLSSQAQDIQKGVKYMSGLRSVLSQSLVDRQNIPDLYEKVDKLGSRIDAIDGKTKSLEQVASSFLQLRGGLCKLLSQSPVDKQNFQGLYQKVDVLGSRIDAIDGKTKSLEQVASSFLQLHGGLRKLLSQSPVDKQNFQGLYQKVDVLGSRIDAIDGKTKTLERICDDYKQNVTRASLGTPTGGLVTGQGVNMVCLDVVGTTGVMEETTGCLVPKRKGVYYVGMRMCQSGDGEMYVRMRYNGDQGIGQPIVQTGCHGDIQSGVCVTGMYEGKEYWFDAVRVKGDPKIRWCFVYCWFLSPL